MKIMAIVDRHDFHAFSALGLVPISDPPPLAITNVASMKHSSSSSGFTKLGLATSVKTRRKISWQHQV